MEAKPKDLLDLSYDILHHIFSFLQVKDIVRLRILSRSFDKTLHITAIPSFCFANHEAQLHDFYPKNCSCTHIFDFMMYTVPQDRPHALTVNRISFSSLCRKDNHADLHKQWITQLFENFRVDELSLDYMLPSIFTSLPDFQSLRVLKLNTNQVCIVHLPKMKLASLETLHIKSIDTYDSVGEWISQSFPSLRHLSLQRITDYAKVQDFTIRSSCLEDLTIHDVCCFKPVRIITENLRTLHCFIPQHVPKCSNKFVLETSAPNLQSLTWVGDVNPRCVWYDEDEFQNLRVTNIHTSLIMKESNWNVLKQLFKAIRSSRKLHIDTQVLKRWLRKIRTPARMLEDLQGETPISLENLHHLEINVRLKIKGEDYITLLERLSNLEALTLVMNYPEVMTNGRDFNPHLEEGPVGDKFKKALINCREHELRRTKGLKKVKFILREFNCYTVVLIGWLMKACTDLEEMTLYYPSCLHEFMMQEGVFYLQRFERASPTPPTFHFSPQNLIP